jgi:2-polyprenyl-3-methyl-5-hydroxy-6-metoxy-1,4-benzoquinol methylase
MSDPAARVVGLDLAEAMVARARLNVAAARLDERIRIVLGDAKEEHFSEGRFEAVISNSIVHHVANPAPVCAEMARSVAPAGTLFVRDLVRPETAAEVAHLVMTYAASESTAARALFEASLHAALTLREVQAIVVSLGYPPDSVRMSSDRHWTWSWRRS